MEEPNLVNLLTLKKIEENVYQNIANRQNIAKAIYGGQVLAQALVAASSKISTSSIHSLHAYFLRPGVLDQPINYVVESLRDGKSISSRRVVAFQNDKPIFHLTASFHASEPGFFHQDTNMTDTFRGKSPLPDPPFENNVDGNNLPLSKIYDEIEIIGLQDDKDMSENQYEPYSNFWFRVKANLGNDMAVHNAALTYISDMRLITTALLPHKVGEYSKGLQLASIDHSIWFHQEKFSVNEWMLFKMYSPWSGNSRGLVRGEIFSSSGTLIASLSQEALIRKKN